MIKGYLEIKKIILCWGRGVSIKIFYIDKKEVLVKEWKMIIFVK